MPDFNLYRNPNLNNALDGRYPAGNAPADPTGPLNVSLNNGVLSITTDGTYDFGTKANAAPMYFWDANDGSLNSSSLSRRAFTLNEGSMLGSSDLQNSTDTLAVVTPQPSGSITTGGAFFTDLDGAGQHIALFSKRKTNFTGLDAFSEQQRLNPSGQQWNVKGWRWWSDVGDNNVVTAYGQSNTTHGNPRINTERTSSGGTLFLASTDADLDFFGFGAGWKTDFYRARQSTEGVIDGLVQWNVNGNTINYPMMSTDATWPNPLRELYWFQAQFLPNELNFTFFYDCFYLDDTPQMVIISDSPTWQDSDTGTENFEFAIPTAWSANSITAEARQGAFSSLTGKYVYVLGADGEPVSTNGVAI